MLKIHSSPSYKDIIAAGGARKRRASNLLSFILFVAYNMVCFVASIISIVFHPLSFFRIAPEFLKYKDAFGFWQLSGNWTKAHEGTHFRAARVDSPSVEIGYYRGDISALHFDNRDFDFGTEYVHPVGIKGAQDFNLWQSVYCDEMTQMAVKSDAFQTVCLVHVIDHIDGPEAVIRELSRVTKEGGYVHFSGISDKYFDVDPKYLLQKFRSTQSANEYKKNTTDTRKSWNCLTKNEWESLLTSEGFSLENFRYIGDCGFYGFVRYFLHFSLFHRGCFEFDFYKRSFFKPMFSRLFNFYYVAVGYPIFLKNKSGQNGIGTDFFISAKKQQGAK